jgi:hypothetical protein
MEKKSQNKKKVSPKADKNELSNLDRSQINELLKDSIENYVIKAKKSDKELDDIAHLINDYVSEFLQTFVIFAYDLKGNPIYIHHANNQMDADALNCLINRIVMNRGE